MTDSKLFSVPIIPMPSPGVTIAPANLPVLHRGEEIARATKREGSYCFTLFWGDLRTGFQEGMLFPKPLFRDEMAADGRHKRTYLGVQIVESI